MNLREQVLPLRNGSHTGLLTGVRVALFEPGFVPVAEVLLFREKDPNSGRAPRDALCKRTPRPAALEGTDASHGRAGQLAGLRQGPRED
ncbi:hypothetical protein [Candidatus Nitrospira allomarina]|uniref:Uncharacterized protein n=1 Tax=Candidatus Nitrospira allomarina TaxID=3020900 RepID=A0AA96GEY9_9BACT|nr:hypothetical protein [Candidatus Nitrospira allomarina]WNM59917.1 hypothetical protein PP769_09220 [Candidatus Nitrospira allomarina]